MALPNYLRVEQGPAIVWGEPGAGGVTHALGVDALANGSARQGAAADLGASWARWYSVYVFVETGTAPTAGNSVDIYLVTSRNNTDWPAKVTGSDGSYTLGTSDANLKQAGPPVVSLSATADGNTVLGQEPVLWMPKGRYVDVIFDNNLGQPIRDEATATDNGTRVILVPLVDKVEDT